MTDMDLADLCAPAQAALARYRETRAYCIECSPAMTAAEVEAADNLADVVDSVLAAIAGPPWFPSVGDTVRPVGGWRKIFPAGPTRPAVVVVHGVVGSTHPHENRVLVQWGGTAVREWVSVDQIRAHDHARSAGR
jgi:predicted alpha/beta-fold hydrolase